MTGRYAIRSGNATVPITTGMYGLTQWEITMAEMLSDDGYATGMFGKWHLGQTKGRFPTDQGFDEWYGIPNSTDKFQRRGPMHALPGSADDRSLCNTLGQRLCSNYNGHVRSDTVGNHDG